MVLSYYPMAFGERMQSDPEKHGEGMESDPEEYGEMMEYDPEDHREMKKPDPEDHREVMKPDLEADLEEKREKLLRAALKDDWEEIKRLLATDIHKEMFIYYEEPIDTRNGNTIFHVLAYHGLDTLLKNVLSEYFDDGQMNCNDPNGAKDYALHLAVQEGHYNVVNALLDEGGAWKKLHKKNKFGETAFHAASMHGDDRILKKLITCSKKIKNFDTKRFLGAQTEGSQSTFFHYLMIKKHYDAAFWVLEELRTAENLLLLQKIACAKEDKNGDTALILLLKNEASFFKSRRGRLNVEVAIERLFKPPSRNQTAASERGSVVFPTYGWTCGRTVSPAAKLLVKLLHVWSNPEAESWYLHDKVLLHLANLGLKPAVGACIKRWGKALRVNEGDSQPTMLQIAAKDRMEGFINWFESADNTDNDWKRVMLQTSDDEGKTALHYAAMPTAQEKRFLFARFATEIRDDYKWFERIKGLLPPDLVSSKAKKIDDNAARPGEEPEEEKLVCRYTRTMPKEMDKNAALPGETPEEMFLRLHTEMAKKNAESLRTMATTSMSLIAAVAFATSFTLPSGVSDKSSGQMKSKEELTFSVFACAYVLGLFFAVATMITSLVLYLSPFDVQSFRKTVPMTFYLCLISLCSCLLSLLVAFACNLRLSLYKYNISNATFLYVSPITLAPYVAFLLIRRIYRQAKSSFKGKFGKRMSSRSGPGATDSHCQVTCIRFPPPPAFKLLTWRHRARATPFSALP